MADPEILVKERGGGGSLQKGDLAIVSAKVATG